MTASARTADARTAVARTAVARTARPHAAPLVLREAPAGDRDLIAWVRRAARLAAPDSVVWCDGSGGERGALAPLVPCDSPSSATPATEVVPAGLHDADALHEQVALSFEDCMQGRTMYVVPFRIPAPGRALAGTGLQLTDSPCVAATLLADAVPFATLRAADRPLKAVHSLGEPLGLRRGGRHPRGARPLHQQGWVARFPQQAETWSLRVEHEPRLQAAA